MALAAVPMAGRCLSGLRRLRLLLREPVSVVAGASVGEALRGFGSLGGPGADATAIGAAGSVGTRGGVLGMAKVVGVAATAGARDGVLGVSSVDVAVGACDGGKLATLDIFVRVLRLVASRYVRTGDSSPPGNVCHPQTWRIGRWAVVVKRCRAVEGRHVVRHGIAVGGCRLRFLLCREQPDEFL